LIRRYWIPAILSIDLPEPGAPKGLRLLGEDLVIFREDSGRIGLIDGRCPHRGVRLHADNVPARRTSPVDPAVHRPAAADRGRADGLRLPLRGAAPAGRGKR
jgi:nitrite reductase/ring-hydroxylating ferredoxin subunit